MEMEMEMEMEMRSRQPRFVFPVRANALVVGHQVSIAVDRCDELLFRLEKVQIVFPGFIHGLVNIGFLISFALFFEICC